MATAQSSLIATEKALSPSLPGTGRPAPENEHTPIATVAYRDMLLWPAPVREGAPLAVLDRGERVVMLDPRGAGDMAHIRLSTGQTGWLERIALKQETASVEEGERPAPVAISPRPLPAPACTAPLRTIAAPAYHRSSDLAEKIGGLLGIEMGLAAATFAPLGLLFLAVLVMSEGMWELGALGLLGVGLAQMVVAVTFFVRLIQWTYRTVQATRELALEPVRMPPSLAVGLYFVPVLNVFWAYGVLSLFWSVSDPRLVQVQPGQRPPRSTTWTPGWLLLGNAFNYLLFLAAFGLIGSATSAGDLVGPVFLMGVSAVLSIYLLATLRSLIEAIGTRLFDQYEGLRRRPEPAALDAAPITAEAAGV